MVHRYALEAREPRADVEPGTSGAAAGLAPDQQAAVLHAGGPARILAPAGSGKTTVLTARFRHLVVERGYGAPAVVALAYNKRAGDEMKARLGDLPGGARRKVRTLNSFGYDILQRAFPNMQVIDEIEMRRRMEPHLKLRFRANTDALAPYLDALEEVRLALRPPAQVEADRGDVDGFAIMYESYVDRLARDGVTDFDGQIYGAVELLLRDAARRAELQRECRHLLVDEFQDLRPAHLLLLRLVAAPAYDVFGVGDDDQVIYGYSGANPDFLIRFDSYFPGATDHPLEVNYRCPPVVVDAARSLLAHNRRRVAKTIRAARTDADDVLRVERPVAEGLAPRAVAFLSEWLAAGVEPERIAVLCRVNAGLLPVQVLAHDAGLPVTIAVGERFLTRTGVRAALAYLRLAVAIANGERLPNSDIGEVIRRPSRRLSKRATEPLTRRRLTIDRVRELADSLDATDATRLHDFVDDLVTLAKHADGGDAAAVLRAVRDDVGLGQAMGTLDQSGKGRDASHLDDLTALIAIAAAHPDPATFESWLREHLRGAAVAADPSRPGEITLSTVHRVKGMEWDRVVVLGAHEGLMPHRLADDIEEERRIFHVALTRGRTEVVLLADVAARAPFVAEAQGKPVERLAEVIPLKAATTPNPDDDPLFAALREWRLARARDDSVPAYVVFHDATLADIAAAKPASFRALARIKGVGPTKIQRYGEDVLRVVAEHA